MKTENGDYMLVNIITKFTNNSVFSRSPYL